MTKWPAALDYAAHLLLSAMADPTLFVTIITPADAATVTTQLMDVQWTFAPGVQTAYQIKIWDTTGVTLVHDTGVVNSSSQFATIDAALAGLVNGTDYQVQVFITTSEGNSGVSAKRDFTLDAVTVSADVAGLTVTPNVASLPFMDLDWTEFVLDGTETFLHYNIWRRVDGGGAQDWVRLTTITTKATVTYADYTAAPNITYDYTVTVRVSVATGEDESNKDTTPPEDSLDFIQGFAHDFATKASNFATLLIRGVARTDVQGQREHQPWGRQLPTVFVGDSETKLLEVTLATQRFNQNKAMWADLTAFLERQRDEGTTVVLRFREETYFGVVRRVRRTDQPGRLYVSSFTFRPIHFDEAV